MVRTKEGEGRQYYMKIGEQIFSYIDEKRKEQGISKKEFAQMIGCTQRAIYYWERGERGISLDMADKALKILGAFVILGDRDALEIGGETCEKS